MDLEATNGFSDGRWGIPSCQIFTKNSFYNYPNITETLLMDSIIFIGLSFAKLVSWSFTASWAGFVVLSECVIDRWMIKTIDHDSSIKNTLETTVIAFSLDFGKFIGRLRSKVFPFFTRFDYFGTR